MPDEDKPVPLRPATPARSRLRPVADPEPELEEVAEDASGDEPASRLVDRIQELAERIEEETAATRSAVDRESELPAKAVRQAAARDAESAARRVAEAKGKHEAPEALPPIPVPGAEPGLPVVKAPAKKAAKAPEKKAPEKKAPAKKAPAKNAPAKAAATSAPATSAPAKKAAAKKAPAKKAPATTGEVRRGLPAPPARPLPRPSAPTTTAAPVPPPPPPPPPPPTAPPPRVVAPTTVVPAPRTAGVRFVAVLSVLLFAAAVGLGVAAYVETGEQTWESRVAVRLVPGPAPTVDPEKAVADGVDRYSDKVPGLTLTAAGDMGIPAEDVRGTFEAAQPEDDLIGIIVHAAHRNQAALLAGAAANELMKAVAEQEKSVAPTPADRLTAVITGTVTKPERTRPDDLVAGLAGGLAALGVLLLSGLVAILRRR